MLALGRSPICRASVVATVATHPLCALLLPLALTRVPTVSRLCVAQLPFCVNLVLLGRNVTAEFGNTSFAPW